MASGKESTCQCRRHMFDPWVGKIPWSRKWLIFLPGEFHGQRNLACCSPWGHKRVGHDLAWGHKRVGHDLATEQLSDYNSKYIHAHTPTYTHTNMYRYTTVSES